MIQDERDPVADAICQDVAIFLSCAERLLVFQADFIDE